MESLSFEIALFDLEPTLALNPSWPQTHVGIDPKFSQLRVRFLRNVYDVAYTINSTWYYREQVCYIYENRVGHYC